MTQIRADRIAAPLVVVGAGLAAVSFIGALRARGWDAPIVVIGDEDEKPYDRPPLSKEFQRGGDADAIRLDLSATTNVEWILGSRAVSLDAAHRVVSLSNGTSLRWGALVIATGASPRIPAFRGDSCFPVFTLRTLDDAKKIRARLATGASLVVIGGGVIGLEIAATAKESGLHPTIIESTTRLMGRCAPATLSAFIASRHADQGIDVRLACEVDALEENGVRLKNNTFLPADFAVVGIGVRANDALARAAGIAADDGIFVDGHGRTTCPGVWAIGDVTRQLNPQTGRFERIETWSNAVCQATAVASAMLEPDSPPYADVPWFWTEQLGIRFQVAGSIVGTSEVVCGDLDSDSFAILQMRNERIIGVACTNQPREFARLKRQIQVGGTP